MVPSEAPANKFEETLELGCVEIEDVGHPPEACAISFPCRPR